MLGLRVEQEALRISKEELTPWTGQPDLTNFLQMVLEAMLVVVEHVQVALSAIGTSKTT